MNTAPFIDASFEPPKSFDSSHFHFCMLEPSVAALDYEAVMSSQKRLQGMFGKQSQWPDKDMTLAENVASLKQHKQEFLARKAFAFSVFNTNKNKCLGSVYIDPTLSENHDCEVYLWIRNSCYQLDSLLYQAVVKWLDKSWPFTCVAFPGRTISWQAWNERLSD